MWNTCVSSSSVSLVADDQQFSGLWLAMATSQKKSHDSIEIFVLLYVMFS